MIVGDDDQSIYGWRGAQVENIQRFLKDFPVRKPSAGAELPFHQQHPESGQHPDRQQRRAHGQNLWTEGGEGEPISIYCAFNELDEARFVVNRIKTGRTTAGR